MRFLDTPLPQSDILFNDAEDSTVDGLFPSTRMWIVHSLTWTENMMYVLNKLVN